MGKTACIPFWVAVRGEPLSDADLLGRFRLSDYRRAGRVPLTGAYVALAGHGDWTLIADGPHYVLWNMGSTRGAVELLGESRDVFACFGADCDDSFAFEYHRGGRLARRYFVVEGRGGPVVHEDVGDPLPGELDPAAQPGRMDVRLAVAAALGAPISAVAYGFLALVAEIQEIVFVDLPDAMFEGGAPAWWPVPWLALCGLLTGLTIRYLPGTGGHSPAFGFDAGGGPPTPRELPGIIVAALTTLSLGAVLGPEAPLIAIGGGLAALTVHLARKDAPPTRALIPLS